jgi:SEC-C motif
MVHPLGMEQAPTEVQLRGIDTLLKERAPAIAVRDKCVSVIRAAADSPSSHGTIGKQASSLIIPGNPAEGVIAEYHAERPTPESYLPNHVVSTSTLGMSVKDIAFGSRDSEGNAVLLVPRVGRNARCPCGSGKKYKHCHGK